MRRYIATFSYISMIVLLNVLLVRLPGVAAFGEHVSLADFFVGAIYLVRDFAQRELKHWVLVAMIVGATISYFLATPTIALASAGAFIVGEMVDWSLFTWLKKPLSQRLIYSSVLSAPVDSVVFLALANRLSWVECSVMTLGKLLGVFGLWLYWRYPFLRKTPNKKPTASKIPHRNHLSSL